MRDHTTMLRRLPTFRTMFKYCLEAHRSEATKVPRSSAWCVEAGPPSLMMSFTADGQLDPEVLANRDKICNVDSGARGRVRSASVAFPLAHPALCVVPSQSNPSWPSLAVLVDGGLCVKTVL